MGREIRRVPPNWEHPKSERHGGYASLHAERYSDACKRWKEEFAQWEAGTHPEKRDHDGEFWDCWEGPPSEECYLPDSVPPPSEWTWWQVYETVSEGTPTTPPFETREELVEWLVTKGDMHGTDYASGPYSRMAAEAFVCGEGYVASMMIERTA